MLVDRNQPEGTVDVNILGRRMRNGEVYVFIYTDDQAANVVRTLLWFANRSDLSFSLRDAKSLAREVVRVNEARKVKRG